MTEGFIIVSVLILIVAVHILARRFAHQIHKNYAGDTKKTRIATFVLFGSISVFFLLLALVLKVASS